MNLIDEFLNKKYLNRIKRELQNEQLEKTISEIDYLNKFQQTVLSRADFTPSQNKDLDLIKQLNNARKKLQA